MAHERCVETVSAVSDQFNRRFCTSLGEAHRVDMGTLGASRVLRLISAPPNNTCPTLTTLGGDGIAAWNVGPDPLVPLNCTKTSKLLFLGSSCR